MELTNLEESKGLASKYRIKRVLGGGGNSTTFVAESIFNPGKDYVLKMISLDDIENSEILKDEVKLHRQLSEHESIISIIDHFIEKNILYVVTEYAEKGDLKLELAKRKNKSEIEEKNHIEVEGRRKSNMKPTRRLKKGKELFATAEIMNLMIKITKGVAYIHSQSIVHKDLKPANIFLKLDGTPQIGDFGISRVLKDNSFIFSVNCTIDYAPPELLDYGKFDFKGDVWAMGVILYELCTGNKPFGFLSGQPKIDFIIEHHPDFTQLNDRDTTLRMLIKSMLKKNPQRRPNMKNVLSSLIIIQDRGESLEEAYSPITKVKSALTIQAHPNADFHTDFDSSLMVYKTESTLSRDLVQELKNETEIENIKLSIYKSVNCIKWICFLIFIISMSQVVIWVDEIGLLHEVFIKVSTCDYKKISPCFQTIYMLNSLIDDNTFPWVDLPTYIIQAIIGIYGALLSFKLTKIRLKLTLLVFYILLFLYLSKIIYIAIFNDEIVILDNLQAIIYIFEVSIPVIIFIILIIIQGHIQLVNYSKLWKMEQEKEAEDKEVEIKHQFTNKPLYEYSNYVYGVGIGLVLLGGQYLFYSICQIIHRRMSENNRYLIVTGSICRSLLYIAGGLYCFLRAKSQLNTMKTSAYCVLVIVITQSGYLVISILFKFRNVKETSKYNTLNISRSGLLDAATGFLYCHIYNRHLLCLLLCK